VLVILETLVFLDVNLEARDSWQLEAGVSFSGLFQ